MKMGHLPRHAYAVVQPPPWPVRHCAVPEWGSEDYARGAADNGKVPHCAAGNAEVLPRCRRWRKRWGEAPTMVGLLPRSVGDDRKSRRRRHRRQWTFGGREDGWTVKW